MKLVSTIDSRLDSTVGICNDDEHVLVQLPERSPWNAFSLIRHLQENRAQFVTLRVGDLLFTGTPSGVGAGRTPPEFLRAGDVTEVEISRIGCLRNIVVE